MVGRWGAAMTKSKKYIPPSLPEDKRSIAEVYDAVVEDIQAMYGNTLTEKEAHEAARNLLGFCQKVVEIRSRELP